MTITSREIVLKTATWCSGQYAGLLLIGCGFNATLGFDFIFNGLCLLMGNSGWGIEW